MFLKLAIFTSILVVPSTSHAKGNLYDFVVGGAIKNLAKIYVKTSSLPKLKAKYIKKIAGMSEEKFRKNYMKFFNVYKELPVDLRQTYTFTERTTKSDVINTIDHVNKKDLMKIINKIPSDFIVQQTRKHAPPKDQPAEDAPKSELFLWRGIMRKI